MIVSALHGTLDPRIQEFINGRTHTHIITEHAPNMTFLPSPSVLDRMQHYVDGPMNHRGSSALKDNILRSGIRTAFRYRPDLSDGATIWAHKVGFLPRKVAVVIYDTSTFYSGLMDPSSS